MGNLAKDNEQVSRLIIADERPFLSYLADNVLYLDKSQEWALYYTIMHIFFLNASQIFLKSLFAPFLKIHIEISYSRK